MFTDKGTLPGGEPHDYAMLGGSDRRPMAGETGAGPLGPAAGQGSARGHDQVAPERV